MLDEHLRVPEIRTKLQPVLEMNEVVLEAAQVGRPPSPGASGRKAEKAPWRERCRFFSDAGRFEGDIPGNPGNDESTLQEASEGTGVSVVGGSRTHPPVGHDCDPENVHEDCRRRASRFDRTCTIFSPPRLHSCRLPRTPQRSSSSAPIPRLGSLPCLQYNTSIRQGMPQLFLRCLNNRGHKAQ